MHSFFPGARWRRLTQLLMLLLTTRFGQAQTPTWQAAIPFTGNQSYVTASAATNGAVYVTGHFTGTATFGSTTLTSVGVGSDLFLAKWDEASQHFVWAIRAGGSTADNATALAVSGSTIYLTGWFASSDAVFGATRLANRSPDTTDCFIAKLTDEGPTATFRWATQLGNTGYDYGWAIAARDNAVYVAGSFTSPSLTIGGTTLLNVGPAAPLTSNGFVSKLLDAGTSVTFAWTQRCGGASSPAALVSTAAGLYMAGTFTGTGTFGSTTLTAASRQDVFVAKLTDQGASSSYVWVQQPRTPDSAEVRALALQGTNVYLAGAYYGTAQFGATTLTSAGATDAFVTKLTDAGPSAPFAWAVSAGGADIDEAHALAVTGSQVYVGGATGSPALRVGAVTVTHATNNYFSRDGFLAQMVDAGSAASVTWAKGFGGQGNDALDALALQGPTLYAGGYISPPAYFDELSVAASAGFQIGYLALLPIATVTASRMAEPAATFTVAPNPARATTTLTYTGRLPAPVQLLSVMGQPVCTLLLTTPSTRLAVGDLPAGVYFVRGAGHLSRLVVE